MSYSSKGKQVYNIDEHQKEDDDDDDDDGDDGGFSASSVGSHNPNSISFSLPINIQEQGIRGGDGKGRFGLKLTRTESFMRLLEAEMLKSENNKKKKMKMKMTSDDQNNMNNNFSSNNSTSEKLKASNFAAQALIIGNWERYSKNEGDLTAKCYYAKRKLVWEVLDGSLKSKIEIHWSDIVGIKAVTRENEPGLLEIELNQAPKFYRETNPMPRKHTLWLSASDFTGGQALICRRHTVLFRPGYLDKNYEKLLQCDQNLLMLSKKPFPTQESPYFLQNIYESFGFNGYGQQNWIPSITNPSSHGYNSNLPMPVMNGQRITNNQRTDWSNGFVWQENRSGSSNFDPNNDILLPNYNVEVPYSSNEVVSFMENDESTLFNNTSAVVPHVAYPGITDYTHLSVSPSMNNIGHQPQNITDFGFGISPVQPIGNGIQYQTRGDGEYEKVMYDSAYDQNQVPGQPFQNYGLPNYYEPQLPQPQLFQDYKNLPVNMNMVVNSSLTEPCTERFTGMDAVQNDIMVFNSSSREPSSAERFIRIDAIRNDIMMRNSSSTEPSSAERFVGSTRR